jgi:hypothetical protein
MQVSVVEAGIVEGQKLGPLMQEANELLAIIVAFLKTAKAKAKASSQIRNRKSAI